MHADILLVILAAVFVLCGIIAVAWWQYLPPEDLPGSDPLRSPWSANSDPGETADSLRAGELQDDEWADRLHVLNADLVHGLGRPVAQLTHYEVEALIRQLGVPEWLPNRYRVAA